MARPKTEAADYTKLMLRLPKDVASACRDMAEENNRSLNAEILHTLLQRLIQEKRIDAPHRPGRHTPVGAPSNATA
jgi:hypothetical protein